MITEQQETVLKDTFDPKLQVNLKCKQKISEQKKARVCTEWRKARSRVAARCRREKESQLFREIAALLPLAPNLEAQLDKASVIRLTIAYLRLRALLDSPAHSTAAAMTQSLSSAKGKPAEVNEKLFLNHTLGGFLLIVSLNGKIIFTTKDVTSHTGISQMDLTGRSLFDFMHPCDQKELKDILTKLIGSQGQHKYEMFLRIKGATNHKLTPWKVIHCTGVKKSSFTPGCNCLLLLCRSLPGQDVIEREAYLNFKTFLSIHAPDMKFTYCQSGVLELMGFSDTELYGQSVYQYYHPSDCQHILKAHLCLFVKGQAYTGKYRMLQKHGGYVWVETDATVVYNIHTGKPESVVCINYILSDVEMGDVVFSLEQTKTLLRPCASLQLNVQPIQTTFSTISTTAKVHTLPPCCEREEAAKGHSEISRIKQKSTVCNSLTCDICELDLDSLAPYIPMDEEDFCLTPSLDGLVDCSDLNRYLSRPCLTQDPEQPRLETVLPATGKTGILPSLQHTDSYLSLTNRVNRGLPWLISSRQRHNFQQTEKRKQQVESTRQIPSSQSKTKQWMTGTAKILEHLTKNSWHNLDGSAACSCYQNPPGSVPWAPIYSKLPWCPPGPLFQCTTSHHAEKTNSAPVSLPVLSRWECETNAPLGPTPQLLQGTELTTVLDQVAHVCNGTNANESNAVLFSKVYM